MSESPACTPHEWCDRGTPGNYWRECWLCGATQDVDRIDWHQRLTEDAPLRKIQPSADDMLEWAETTFEAGAEIWPKS